MNKGWLSFQALLLALRTRPLSNFEDCVQKKSNMVATAGLGI
jgi:hypothetical protein